MGVSLSFRTFALEQLGRGGEHRDAPVISAAGLLIGQREQFRSSWGSREEPTKGRRDCR